MARLVGSLVLLSSLAWSAAALAQNATTPGQITTPHPTCRAISIEWAISGDDNQDGVVTVRYRAVGDSSWLTGLPLRRIPADANVQDPSYSWTNKHSGSLFDLSPATDYEIELTLDDPDGGSTTQTVQETTRPIPEAPPGAVEVGVTTATFAAALSNASPGEILVLADGDYGGFSMDVDGTPDNPIILRAANPGGAVITDNIELIGRSDVWLEGLVVTGRIRLNNTQRMVIRDCTIHADGDAIVAWADGTADSYICDNVLYGQGQWTLDDMGAGGFNGGEGIQLAGPGNVVCHNYVEGFRDGISTMEDGEAYEQYSIDIYGNDIHTATDDGIEADFTMGNVRVMRNRLTNTFIGLSGQPTLGGPLYFIRNVQYNTFHVPFKLYRGSVGDVVLHNTTVKYGDAFGAYPGSTRLIRRAWVRNNLFIGGHSGTDYATTNGGYDTGSGDVVYIVDLELSGGDACSLDYDGYGAVGTSFGGRIGAGQFDSLAALRANTTEVHGQEVDLSIFAAPVAFPDPPTTAYSPPDLRLAGGNAAVDTGEPLPGINDGFAGAGPDLGAYELGQALPVYGPRGEVTGPDGGTTGPDAGVGGDAGAGSDGGASGDAGTVDDPSSGDGCGCASAAPSPAPLLLLLLGGLWWWRRWRRS